MNCIQCVLSKPKVVGTVLLTLITIGLLAIWWHLDQKATYVAGLTEVKPGMTSQQVMSILGPAVRRKSELMRPGIYGVPDEMEDKIGHGNRFEMWEYEATKSSNAQHATVWLVPPSDAPVTPIPSAGDSEGHRVIDVTTVRLRWSLWFRFCHSSFGEWLQRALGIDE